MKKKKTDFYKTLFKYTSDYKKNLILSVVFAMMNGAVHAALPLVIKYILDDAIQNAALSDAMRLRQTSIDCAIYV